MCESGRGCVKTQKYDDEIKNFPTSAVARKVKRDRPYHFDPVLRAASPLLKNENSFHTASAVRVDNSRSRLGLLLSDEPPLPRTRCIPAMRPQRLFSVFVFRHTDDDAPIIATHRIFNVKLEGGRGVNAAYISDPLTWIPLQMAQQSTKRVYYVC